MEEKYVDLITEKPVEKFLRRFFLSDAKIEALVIISPIIGTLKGTRFELSYLCDKISHEKITTFVITREPQESTTEGRFHKEAVDILFNTNMTEIRYNNSLHAKIYICVAEDKLSCFGMLGSANLTYTSIEKNIEVGIMIYNKGRGREILRELYHFGAIRLRTLPESKIVKKIKFERRN